MEKFIHQLAIIVNKLMTDADGISIPFLSNRELDILILAGRGYRTREIGDKLAISQNTVKNLLYRIYKKLNVRKREQIRQYLNLVI